MTMAAGDASDADLAEARSLLAAALERSQYLRSLYPEVVAELGL